MQSAIEWTSLIKPESAPDLISIEHNGEKGTTVTKLLKVNKPDGSIHYVGTPTKNGRPGRYNLIVETNGFIIGSAAMNFIANGGWSPGDSKPSHTVKCKHREEFVRKFVSTAIVHQGLSNMDELVEDMEQQTGLKVVAGVITEGDEIDLGLIGAKAHIVELAINKHYRFEIDVAKHISRWVQTSYATVIPGEWDSGSAEVATTSALSYGHVALMRRHGLRFKKVRMARKTATG
jgi:hypothetical protein